MAEWKKVIVSGSNAELNGLQVSTSVTASSYTGSFVGDGSQLTGIAGAAITYVTASGNQNLSEIEVIDFDADVAVTYTGGRLKFIFGTPAQHSISSFGLSGFLSDRFNQVPDAYTVTGTWSLGAYTLISASIYQGATLVANTGAGSSLTYNANDAGTRTYTLHVTASSPLDNSVVVKTATAIGTVTKLPPGNPTLNATPSVQLGAAGGAIEQGATGSISFTSGSGASNGWVELFTSTNVASPVAVPASSTGLTIIATSHYSSSGVGGADNSPPLNQTTTAQIPYTKIRSIRGGASAQASFTQAELEDLGAWDVTLGGTIGTIVKGTTTPGTVTFSYSGNKYLYVVYDASRPPLTAITAAGFNVIGNFTLSTVGPYKVYRSNVLNAGGAGTTQTYVLT